jgi:cytochrome c oxidase subunit 2
MSVIKTMKMLSSWLAAILLFGPAIALADYKLNMTPGVTEISHEVFNIHMLVLWIVTVVGVVVFAVMIYSIINHRKSKGAKAAHFHESTAVEVIWTVVPLVILVALAVPATKTILKMDNMKDSDINIKVTGSQWKWQYEYMDEAGLKFISNLAEASNKARALKSGIDPRTVENYLLDVDEPMYVPIGKKVRMLIASTDVIHSWWVPALGMKRDAIPGYIRQMWFRADEEGIYRGQCAELCGKDHGFMPIVVHVVSEAKYKDWVAAKKQLMAAGAGADDKTFSKEELLAKGQQLYNTTCAGCHGVEGVAAAPIFPNMKGSKIATGKLADHLAMVIHGSKKNPTMTAFGKQFNNLDLAAIITYERNAFGNNTGDVVQPATVKAAR